MREHALRFEGITAEVVASSTGEWLKQSLRQCRSRFLVASPFVGNALPQLVNSIPDVECKTLVTSTHLRHFALGASNIESICDVADMGMAVKSHPSLHAKVYVVDDAGALITSANATRSGLWRNTECGVALDEADAVRAIADLVLRGFASGSPPVDLTREELRYIRNAIPSVRLPRELAGLPSLVAEDAPEYGPIEVSDSHVFVESFRGWTRLTLDGVLEQGEEFTLDDIFGTCLPRAEEQYPDNQHVRAKVRQQLQVLRDMGLVQFLGRGHYRRTLRT